MKDWIHLDRLTITGPKAALARFRALTPATGGSAARQPQPAEPCGAAAGALHPGVLGGLAAGVCAGGSCPVIMCESPDFICCEFHTTWAVVQEYFLGVSRRYPRLRFTLYFHVVSPVPDQFRHVVFTNGRIVQSHAVMAAGPARLKGAVARPGLRAP